jgi:hypothetical protein
VEQPQVIVLAVAAFDASQGVIVLAVAAFDAAHVIVDAALDEARPSRHDAARTTDAASRPRHGRSSHDRGHIIHLAVQAFGEGL